MSVQSTAQYLIIALMKSRLLSHFGIRRRLRFGARIGPQFGPGARRQRKGEKMPMGRWIHFYYYSNTIIQYRDGFIMSPSNEGSGETKWSNCSSNAAKEATVGKECLLDKVGKSALDMDNFDGVATWKILPTSLFEWQISYATIQFSFQVATPRANRRGIRRSPGKIHQFHPSMPTLHDGFERQAFQ